MSRGDTDYAVEMMTRSSEYFRYDSDLYYIPDEQRNLLFSIAIYRVQD